MPTIDNEYDGLTADEVRELDLEKSHATAASQRATVVRLEAELSAVTDSSEARLRYIADLNDQLVSTQAIAESRGQIIEALKLASSRMFDQTNGLAMQPCEYDGGPCYGCATCYARETKRLMALADRESRTHVETRDQGGPMASKESVALVTAVRAAVASMERAGDGRVLMREGRALAASLKDFDAIAATEVAATVNPKKAESDHECG